MSEEGPKPPSDIAALTARMVKGDEAAYRLFYEQYFSRLLRYMLVVTQGQEEAAQEALQSTLLRVVRHIKVFHAEEVFWSWLTVLARSAVVDEERKRRRYSSLLARFFDREQIRLPAPSGDSDARLRELLAVGLGSLNAEERELIERKYFDHEPVKVIAEKWQSSEKAIESRLGRARRRLKDSILGELHDGKSK